MEYYDISTSPGPGDWEEEEREINGDADGGEEVVEVEEKIKHEKADPVLSSHVVAILSQLGHYNRMTNTYQLNHADAQSCLRDLIKFLRNDGMSFFVRRQMGISDIVSNDLLPIIEQHTVDIDTGNISQEGKLIMDRVIRLLVDLTNPTMLHYRDGKIPKDEKDEIPIYFQLQQILYKYKISFALKKRFWIVLAKHLTRILTIDEDDRELEDAHMFERIIILIRNVLHIPRMEDQSLKNAPIDSVNVQDRIIEHLHDYNILDILQYMVSENNFHEYCFHVIEIIFLIYREQNAEFIAKSVKGDMLASENLLPEDRESLLLTAGRSDFEIDIDRKEIEEARLRDRHTMEEMLKKMPKYGSGKYSRPTFVVKGMKSISDRDMICHQLYKNPELEIDLNKDKKKKIRARNRRLMEDNMDNSNSMGVQQYHKSSRKIRLILAEFANKFLDDYYNPFMKVVKQNLTRGASQDHDETYYLWAIQFFMEFNRYRSKATQQKQFDCVLETVNVNMFHYIQTLIDDYMEHLEQKQFKDELGDWAKRLHCALRTYRELLFTIEYFDSFKITEAKKLSNKIKTDLFTEQEYRELLWTLLRQFDEMKMSKAYLRDLIETNHLFLKMLEYHVKISYNFKVNVKQKVIKRSNKNKKSSKDKKDDEVDGEGKASEPEAPKDPEQIWNDIHEKLLESLNSENFGESNIIETTEELRELFDPLSERSLDEQKLYLMRKINYLLLEKDIETAVGLFREARLSLLGVDVDNTFGEMDISVEDELNSLKEILMTEFPEVEKNNYDDDEHNDENGSEPENEEDDDDEDKRKKKEVYFNMDDTIRNYAKPEILKAYRLMLKNYRSNKPETNHAIVRMLHRIAVDIKMTPMFFNLGYFNYFEKILSDPALKYQDANDSVKDYVKSIKELGKFAYFVTRKFFKLLEKYPKIAIEICFLPNSRDAYSMEFGYDDCRVGSELKALKKQKKHLWTPEQELELEVLYRECKEKIENGEIQLKLPDGKKRDIVDLIQERLMEQDKSRRQIISQLRKMNLLEKKIRVKKPNSDVVVQYSSGEEDNNDNEKILDDLEEGNEAKLSDSEDKDVEIDMMDENNKLSNDENKSPNKGKNDKKVVKKKKDKKKDSNFFDLDKMIREDFNTTFKKKTRAVIMDSDDEGEKDEMSQNDKNDDSQEDQENSFNNEDDDDEVSFTKSNSLRIDDGDDIENDDNDEDSQQKISKKRKRIFDDEDDDNMNFEDDNSTNSDMIKPKKIRLIDDDDDDKKQDNENNEDIEYFHMSKTVIFQQEEEIS